LARSPSERLVGAGRGVVSAVTATRPVFTWTSEGLSSFVRDPHTAIEEQNRGTIVNLADARAERSRHAQLALVAGGPASAKTPDWRRTWTASARTRRR
jgi:hypothetical protein